MKPPAARILALCALILATASFAVTLRPYLPAFAAGPAGPDAPGAVTAVPSTLAYQGTLRLANGTAANGTYDMRFRIYADVAGNAAPLYTEQKTGVQVRDGFFNVALGDSSPTGIDPAVFADAPRYIGIQVGTDPEMAPRQRLHPVPWAQQATLALNANDAARATTANTANTANIANTLTPGSTINADSNIFVVLTLQSASTIGTWLDLRNTSTGGRTWNVISTGKDNSEGAGKLLFRVDNSVKMTVDPNGNVGIGTVNPSYKLDVVGKVKASSGFNGKCNDSALVSVRSDANLKADVNCNQDVAETFATTQQTEPGDLVVLLPEDREHPTVRLSRGAYDGGLVGVVSTNPGLVFDRGQTYLAGENTGLITADKTVVAMIGRVPVKVSLENGPIAVGDPLTSSSTPGVAMKATQAGQILGYAMQSSAEATDGKLMAWLQLGHYLPPQLMAALNDGGTSAQTVAALKTENVALAQQVAALKADNATLDARLSALERGNTAAGLPQWALAVGAVMMGLVVTTGVRARARR